MYKSYTIESAFFNIKELNKLIEFIHLQEGKIQPICLDFSKCKHLGLHEMTMLLVILRHFRRSSPAQLIICLPQLQSVIKFLARWNWFTEIHQHPEEYQIERIIVGSKLLPDYLAGIEPYSRSTRFLSTKVMSIKRVNSKTGSNDYVTELYKNHMISILYQNITKNLNEIRIFLDVIVQELLDNIVKHVITYNTIHNTLHKKSNRTGFITMQTFSPETIEKIGFNNYFDMWPDFIEPFIAQTRGVVVLSVVDDGSGIMETLTHNYNEGQIPKFKSHVDAIKFACLEGVSRYNNCISNQKAHEEFNLIKENAYDFSDDDNKLNNYLESSIESLRKKLYLCNKFGYGLYKVINAVRQRKGIALIRSGDSYYCPKTNNILKTEMEQITKTTIPGVQVQILLPMGV